MTEHTFDLAAALVDKAVEQLADRNYGITRVLFHEFGSFPLCYNHTRHDTGHGVKMWAYDDTGLLAAAEASAPHVGGTPEARIVNFRAGHLTFGVLDEGQPGETVFFARGAHRCYTLTAQPGSSSWVVVVIGSDHAPRTFTGLAQALDHILDELGTAAA